VVTVKFGESRVGVDGHKISFSLGTWFSCVEQKDGGGCGDASRSLPRDGGVEELHGDPTVAPCPKVWTIGQKWKKWKKKFCTNVSLPQRGGAVPAPLSERWAEVAK